MFAYMRGQLMHAEVAFLILEIQGIGYKIFIPASLFVRMPPIGSEMQLHLSFVVRELSQTLYGFFTMQERDLFETLIGVTGIGPKLALSLIGHLSLADLHHAVQSEEIASLVRVPGVGRKTAERLLIELRDKLPEVNSVSSANAAPLSPSQISNQKMRDGINALVNLGYQQAIAQKAIKKVLTDHTEEVDLASLITYALKNM